VPSGQNRERQSGVGFEIPNSVATARCDFPDVLHSSTAWARYSAGYLCGGAIGTSSAGLTPQSWMSTEPGQLH
jgi:hypothetical protein